MLKFFEDCYVGASTKELTERGVSYGYGYRGSDFLLVPKDALVIHVYFENHLNELVHLTKTW